MAWQKQELEALRTTLQFYRDWIADLEAGNEPIVTRRELGRVVDDREETLARYRRNVEEIEAILNHNNVDFGA